MLYQFSLEVHNKLDDFFVEKYPFTFAIYSFVIYFLKEACFMHPNQIENI